MKHFSKLSVLLPAAIAGMGYSASGRAALDLDYITGTNGTVAAPYVTYGDANSYSLPVLGILHDIIVNGETYPDSIQPSNPYYVTSTPGAIKSLVVVGTGASGQDVNTNFTGMDDAYPTPNSDGITYFSTDSTADPGGAGEFTGDAADTWDVRLDAFSNWLDGETPVWLFNNNQVNSGASTNQNLAAWAQVTLYDDAGVLDPLNLVFSNLGGAYALVSEGGGGIVNGTAGTGYTGSPVGPTAGTNAATDYVLSGGALCYSAALAVISCTDSNGDPNPLAVGGPINHNLGANEAVYAVVFPELDRILLAANFEGYDSLSLDWRMGCDPTTTTPDDNCIGRSLNNGYEQLFIATQASAPPGVPVPGTLALLGGALFGMAAIRRRKITS